MKNCITKEDKVIMENEELYHHGVLGMHWGVRKAPTREELKTIHNNKPKKPDVPGVTYHRNSREKSSRVLSKTGTLKLAIQMGKGQVTSFVETNGGKMTIFKTQKGVVVRDKDGNRITDADYERAQKVINTFSNRRINTGMWS